MDRRAFVRTGAAALAGLAAGTRPLCGAILPGITSGDATVFEAEGITEEQVSALIAALGGWERLLNVPPARATVLLKPNLCLPDPPQRGTGTSPLLLELLCKSLIAGGVRRIVIADHTLRGSGTDFEKLPVFELPQRYPEVKVVLANEERMYETVPVEGKVLRSTERLRLLGRADLFINVPTAKHHSATQVSLGVKNLMGVIWNRADFHTKMDLSQAIGDLATLIRPSVTIVDAGRVLLTGGPTGPGKIVQDDRLFASRDIVAVDAVVTSRYNFGDRSTAPREVHHLRAAADLGVGVVDLERIAVSKV
jgi:uncharacterized protein (DUF362 family)